VLRAINARRVLAQAWDLEAFTASDLMAATGLTRSTVIGLCDELVDKGWLAELSDARSVGDYRKGRPARRYALRADAGFVVGVDAGYDRMSATVADLRGRTLGHTEFPIPAQTPESVDRLADAEARRRLARAVVREALAAAGVNGASVLALTAGVPAPVDDEGVSPRHAMGFWQLVNPALQEVFASSAPLVTLENDANLAAIAERTSRNGRGRDSQSYIAMLVGEGIGAGLMIDGRLIRGRRGGAGEMRFLDHVEGVGSANGLALLARRWASEAIRAGGLPAGSALAGMHPEDLSEADVEKAAMRGDKAAAAIIERLARRLARICIVLGDLLDVELVIIGGAVATSLPTVIEQAAAIVARSADPTAPRVLRSALGAAEVGTGAVQHALALVRERALELLPTVRSVA
jgi:predicted NBD/HSP70 family sugar kinase